jgi:phospholipase/carboxylesterase
MTDALGFVHHYEAGTKPLTLLLLHGTGGDEQALVPMARALASGAHLLSPRGKVLEGMQPRFFRRLAEGVFDEQDLILRAGELAAFVEAAAREYGFDANRVVAMGYSNGANIGGALLLLHPGTLAGAVLLRPMVPLVPDPLPDLRGVKVFAAAGRYDELVQAEQSEAIATLLREAGADVTLRWHDAGHRLMQAELDEAARWLAANF